MIHYLRHHQIDKLKWDACIEASKEGVICVLSWYLDIVSPNWHALVDKENDVYISVMPLTGSSKMGFARLGSPHFCQQLGIISARPNMNTSIIEQFLKETIKRFRFVHNYKFITDNTDALEQLSTKFHLSSRHTRYLDLNSTYDNLYKGYNRDRKMNLKRAKRAGLSMTESDDIEPMLDFFKAHVAHKVVGGVAEPTYQMLRDLYLKMRTHGLVKLFYTSKDGVLNAGCLFTIYKGKISYTFNAADLTGRTLNGRTLILDEVIRQHAGSAYVFDFESPAIEQIDQFYASFGAEQVKYFALHHNALPLPVRLVRDIRIQVYHALKLNKGIAEEE